MDVVFFDLAFFIYGFVVVLGFLGYFYRPKRSKKKAENVEFVIPSVADERTFKALKETVGRLRGKFGSYKIWVVVDEGCEREVEETEKVVVPDVFEGKKCKGRSLEYFKRTHARDDTWYVFLDDDSYPLDSYFLHEIPYYERSGYVAANGVLTPRKGGSDLCYILDHMRLWDDLFLFRLNTGLLKKPLIGFHGELLIIKGSVLREVGFSDSLVEDFHLAQQLVKKKYRTWQSRTRVSIRSPNTLQDLWKQRARWMKGILCELKNCSTMAFLFVFFKIVGGLASSVIFLPLWFCFPTTIPALAFFGVFGTLYYISSYVRGIWHIGSKRWLVWLPVMGVLEPIALFFIPRIKNFYVVDKN